MQTESCPTCRGRIEKGVFHACQAPSYSAPWLPALIEEANRPLIAELVRIRQLLERQSAGPRANQRETRTGK